jgi:ubiquinone/menaquinone biosynthesis C-methylase UbiE
MEGVIAKWYTRSQRSNLEQYRSWARIAKESIGPRGDVLEVAPGPGYLSIELAQLGNYKITGLDISETFVKIAGDKTKEAGVNIDFHKGDAAYMPFTDGSFDFAICTSAFKNFPEPLKVLDEVFRVLKAGGNALIIDLRRDASNDEINEYVVKMKLNILDSFLTKVSFRTLLRSAYSIKDIQEIVGKSMFKKYRIVNEGIGFELWLEKN